MMHQSHPLSHTRHHDEHMYMEFYEELPWKFTQRTLCTLNPTQAPPHLYIQVGSHPYPVKGPTSWDTHDSLQGACLRSWGCLHSHLSVRHFMWGQELGMNTAGDPSPHSKAACPPAGAGQSSAGHVRVGLALSPANAWPAVRRTSPWEAQDRVHRTVIPSREQGDEGVAGDQFDCAKHFLNCTFGYHRMSQGLF